MFERLSRLFIGLALGLALPTPLCATIRSVDGPLPDTREKGVLVWNLESRGYVAEEYLLSGTADITESTVMSDAVDLNQRDFTADLARRSFRPVIVRRDVPYVTRLVVYRPADPARFSGNVVVEPFHPNSGGIGAVWREVNGALMDNGDAYVAIQHPLQLDGLKRAHPQRYAMLKAEHPTQLWGMIADTGRLLKAAKPRLSPLHGYAVRRVYLTGYSYTGVAAANFANTYHDVTRVAGRPVFDGYLPMGNATYVRPIDVPVFRVNTQSDFDSFGGLGNRSPEKDSGFGRHRLWEIAGASHLGSYMRLAGEGVAPAPIATAPPGPRDGCPATYPKGFQPNDFALPAAMAAAFDAMYLWVDNGLAPPRAPVITSRADGRAALDADGNAIGGLRLPQIDVPIAVYGVGQTETCRLLGYRVPIPAARLRELHGDKPGYIAKVRASAARLTAARFLRPRDGAAMIARAEAEADAAFAPGAPASPATGAGATPGR